MHTDTSVYSKPFEFMPERWLDENFNQNMMRNFVPFARGMSLISSTSQKSNHSFVLFIGSRRCLGHNLAMAELSLALAVFFRPGGPRLELFESDTSDTNHVHDYVVPLPRLNTKGIRVTVN
jgi:cytochrome P450